MKIGIIGGPFFWKLWGIEADKIEVTTPYGEPADYLFKGNVGKHEVVSLLRHGNGNTFAPPEVPYLANVYAMGTFKPDFVIHSSACGALTERLSSGAGGDIFLFDQLIDFTKFRPNTFGSPVFDTVHHLDFSSPVSPELIDYAHKVFLENKIGHHFKGTMLTEEGARFSTAAESKMYRIMGADAVNQTSCPEVYLLRELGIPVLAISLITNSIGSDFVIDSDEITGSIKKFSQVIPSAVRLLIEKLPQDLELRKPKVGSYDITKFDHR